jgi:tetratricopeptide (TPR) repeat protein
MLREIESGNFVGREVEVNEFRQTIKQGVGGGQILLISGSGGIGKTMLLKRMLAEARSLNVPAPRDPLDLFSTDLRNIDAIQLRVIETIEDLTGWKGLESPFAEFRKPNQDTGEQFNQCLRAFCKKQPLVLAFDTLESLEPLAGNWLFESGVDGLQVPGLYCLIAGRSEMMDLPRYRSYPLVREIQLSGLTSQEAQSLYQRISNELGQVDLLDGLLAAAGIRKGETEREIEGFDWIWKITQGHPLRLEMAIRWAGTLLQEDSLVKIEASKFEEKLMKQFLELGERGLLDVGSLRISRPLFDTLLCMAYVTRRFDERFLQFLTRERLIHVDDSQVMTADILENLERYFFVKRRIGGGGEYILQLHDEMARLMRSYVWPYIDVTGSEKSRLLRAVLRFYDGLIELEEDFEDRNILRVEQLYYALQYDPMKTGRRLWFALEELDDPYVNNLLPGEIRSYIARFDLETQFEVLERIAQNEQDANHWHQARGHWLDARKLAEEHQRDDWMASVLFGLANCERDVSKTLKAYHTARLFCEKKAPQYLANVYYNLGFTYRRMQNVSKAIDWYRKARAAFRKYPSEPGLEAKIANDLGYAYSLVGDWEEGRKNLREGIRIRQFLFPQHEIAENELASMMNNERAGNLRKVCFQLGLSYNTLGEVYRHDDDLDEAMQFYSEALKLFRVTNNHHWQARALFSRGETYRRIARNRYRTADEKNFRESMRKAREDIEESLYLCEKYQVRDERDTANRRLGQVLDDLAMHALEAGDRTMFHEYLEQAKARFEAGLKYARETHDSFEELLNLSELAFMIDDIESSPGSKELPPEYRGRLAEFKLGLDKHRKDPYRIYQFPVLENLYKLVHAAWLFQEGKWRKARDLYLEGFVGLASSPGYGRRRYKEQFPYLTEQIMKLPANEAKTWCEAFIDAWETTPVPGRKDRTLADDVLPDLVVWCRHQLRNIEAAQI